MRSSAGEVVRHMAMTMITGADTTEEVETDCRYRAGDPLAVRVEFPPALALDCGPAEWTLSRDLLLIGLREPAGEGDVMIGPVNRARTMIALVGGQGVALLEVGTGELAAFLAATLALVPAGAEGRYIDWDTELRRLLAG